MPATVHLNVADGMALVYPNRETRQCQYKAKVSEKVEALFYMNRKANPTPIKFSESGIFI